MNKVVPVSSYELSVPYPSDQRERENLEALDEKQQELLQQLLYECVNQFINLQPGEREDIRVVVI